jgi:hypothetical protein
MAGTTSVYHIGNSWTDQACGMHDIAKARGTPTTWGRHMIPGAPLEWIWDHPDQGFQKPCGYATSLPERAWDVVVLQPWDRNTAGSIVTIQHTYTENLRARPGRNVAGMTNVEAY